VGLLLTDRVGLCAVQMSLLSESTVSLVVESLWDTMLTCPYAAECFLRHIKQDVSSMAITRQQVIGTDTASRHELTF
jgi:hypothetical protein